ncbi:hypothetical protein [Microbacterium sp. YY-01]|uniref:hypothetical protein n=1 Tax=Microbacterium sp. YY-01 TaxID=3421634 RepID=UPI003D17A553
MTLPAPAARSTAQRVRGTAQGVRGAAQGVRGTTQGRTPSWRLVWMLPAGLALLAGLDAGLLLLGLPAPIDGSRLPRVHGMLLVLGFVATLISLERATALRRWYGFSAPALLGAGGVLIAVSAVPLVVGQSVLIAGAAAFTLIYIPLWQRQYDAALLTQMLAAGLATVGAIIWLGHDGMDRVLPWLIGFIVLTIAAERVELARITLGPTAGPRLLMRAWAMTAALLLGLVLPDLGAIALGLTLLSLAGWLIVHDVARKTVRAQGVTRFMAACILAGYVWLVVAAIILLFGSASDQRSYDAVVHAVFLGYTFSMIMAHATTILPAVLGIRLPYRAAFWVPAVVLQIALIIRLWVGDGFALAWGWQLGGFMGVVALLLFVATALVCAIIEARSPSRTSSLDKALSGKGAGAAPHKETA